MNIFEIFSDVIAIAEALMKVKSTMHKTHDMGEAIMELEEKAIAPVKDLCKKICGLLHLHIGQGEQKIAEINDVLNITGAKELLTKHENLITKEEK